MGEPLKKMRLSTTISLKHMELLKKYSVKYETQQKALEVALEKLDKSENMETLSLPSRQLSNEEKMVERYWECMRSTKTACYIQKDGLRFLLEGANIKPLVDQYVPQKPMVYSVEYFYQKSLLECSLKELIDAMILISNLSNWFDTYECLDNDDNYKMILTHSLGYNNSLLHRLMIESLFISYGVKVESTISEKTIIMKIFKDR